MDLGEVSGAAQGALSQSLACSEGGDKRSAVALLFSFQLWVLPLREPDQPSLQPGGRDSENSTVPTRLLTVHSTPAPCVVDSHAVCTQLIRILWATTGLVRTKRGQRSWVAQEAEVKGSWPGSSAGKGLLTKGPRTAEPGEAWWRLEVAFPCRVGARPKGSWGRGGAKFGRVRS